VSADDHVKIVCTDRGQHKPTVLTAYEPDGVGGYRASNTFSSRGHNRGRRRPIPGEQPEGSVDQEGVIRRINRFANRFDAENEDPRRAVRIVPSWGRMAPDGPNDDSAILMISLTCPRCTRKPQFKPADLDALVGGAVKAGLNTVDVSREDR